MKYYAHICFIFFLSLFIISCEKEDLNEQASLKVCSFNIRFDNPEDGFNNWENRRKNVVNFLGVEKPDLIGFQEVPAGQLEYIEKRLSDYSRVGVGRDDGIAAGEFAPVLFRSGRFGLFDSGTFWLSETPQTSSAGGGGGDAYSVSPAVSGGQAVLPVDAGYDGFNFTEADWTVFAPAVSAIEANDPGKDDFETVSNLDLSTFSGEVVTIAFIYYAEGSKYTATILRLDQLEIGQ